MMSVLRAVDAPAEDVSSEAASEQARMFSDPVDTAECGWMGDDFRDLLGSSWWGNPETGQEEEGCAILASRSSAEEEVVVRSAETSAAAAEGSQAGRGGSAETTVSAG